VKKAMSGVIEHIDAIARQKKRDVLYVEFHCWGGRSNGGRNLMIEGDWRTLPVRNRVIEWLDANGIGWNYCGHFANVNFHMAYIGQIYIDIPYDKTLPDYQKLESFLENPDGTKKFTGIKFCYLSHDVALQNAEHDEPGFWERWAENF
jgi:hypothetical protein